MNTDYKLENILKALGERTTYTWLAGKNCISKTINLNKAKSGNSSLVGHLNLIHPNQIQLIGKLEQEYLNNLNQVAFNDTLKHLFSENTVLIILETRDQLRPGFNKYANEKDTGLIYSPMNSYDLLHELHYLFSHFFSPQETRHGVFMEVAGKGVLIKGKPGAGKSEVALELITRGHRLVADDAVEFSRTGPSKLTGSCPNLLQNFLEVRGLGILNIKSLYGDNAIKTSKNLTLIIELVNIDEIEDDGTDTARLHGIHSETTIMGIIFPKTILPVAPGRNLAVMIEVTVRNHLLKMSGYEAFDDLHERLLYQMDRES